MRLRSLVASRCRNRQPYRFYGYEVTYTFSTLRKLRGSICKGILIRTHHLLQDFCTNSYELLIHFDAHNWRIYTQSDAHRCVTNLCFRLLRKQASRRLGSEYSPSYFAENTSFKIFGEEVHGFFVGLVKSSPCKRIKL